MPWLYVITGLAFGYSETVQHGTRTVKPWAWLVATESSIAAELAILAVGISVAAVTQSKRIQESDA